MACQNPLRLSTRFGPSLDESPELQPPFHQHAVGVPRVLGDIRWLDDNRARGFGIAKLDPESRPDYAPTRRERLLPCVEHCKYVVRFPSAHFPWIPAKEKRGFRQPDAIDAFDVPERQRVLSKLTEGFERVLLRVGKDILVAE